MLALIGAAAASAAGWFISYGLVRQRIANVGSRAVVLLIAAASISALFTNLFGVGASGFMIVNVAPTVMTVAATVAAASAERPERAKR